MNADPNTPLPPRKQSDFDVLQKEMMNAVEEGIKPFGMRPVGGTFTASRNAAAGIVASQPHDIGDVRDYIGSAQRMLEVARRAAIEATSAYNARRSQLLDRMADELRKLDEDHASAMHGLMDTIRKLEALRAP